MASETSNETIMNMYNFDTRNTESIDLSVLTESQGMCYLPDTWPEVKEIYKSRIDSGDTVGGALIYAFRALVTDSPIELYNYDTQETDSIALTDLTESKGMSYLPKAWPEVKGLYMHRIDTGDTVLEALLFVFNALLKKDDEQ